MLGLQTMNTMQGQAMHVRAAMCSSHSARKRSRHSRCFAQQALTLEHLPDTDGATWRPTLRRRFIESLPEGGVVYLRGGTAQTRNGRDGHTSFRQESNFLYLTGVTVPNYECILETDSGRITLLAPDVSPEMAVWTGSGPTLEDLAERYGMDACIPCSEASRVLAAAKADRVYTLDNVELPDGCTLEVDTTHVKKALAECRTYKCAEEIDCLQHANDVSGQAHVAMWQNCTPGVYEYQLEAVFGQYTMHQGLRHFGYPCIVGSGQNSAILHYDRNTKQVADGDLVLVDAGAEWGGYTADITRTFPANGQFSPMQRDLYQAVLGIQESSLAMIQPGAKWETVGFEARRTATRYLIDLGLLTGTVDELMDIDASRLFFPHGLGHLLGLEVHDVGVAGPVPEVLKEGMVVTCEPGIYFIDPILQPALEDPTYQPYLQKDQLESFRHVGGVRIEDDVALTSDGVRNLTSAPKRMEDIEALMMD
ncbi:hypothetical protein CYMTET_27913 [Cymbomonas tetramitiformis]|uniref:Aminopeptidase P N-terminal domain-containing protein n=1 Tax=Cymbomonas tetramitiformis TaxID=36881 RepID=A0AAE0FQD4_9CHLO|nr:hypothetical protein CYMTET_27913 [Cymbomonas tetramitiformis]